MRIVIRGIGVSHAHNHCTSCVRSSSTGFSLCGFDFHGARNSTQAEACATKTCFTSQAILLFMCYCSILEIIARLRAMPNYKARKATDTG